MPPTDTFKVDDDGELARLLLNGQPVFTCSHAEWRRLVTWEATRLGLLPVEPSTT